MPDLSKFLEARAALDRHLGQPTSRSRASLRARIARRVCEGRAWSAARSIEVVIWCGALAAVIGFAACSWNPALLAMPSLRSASEPTGPVEITPAIIRKLDEAIVPAVDRKADNLLPAVNPSKNARLVLASRLRLAAAAIPGTTLADWEALNDPWVALPGRQKKPEEVPVAAATHPDLDETGTIDRVELSTMVHSSRAGLGTDAAVREIRARMTSWAGETGRVVLSFLKFLPTDAGIERKQASLVAAVAQMGRRDGDRANRNDAALFAGTAY